VKNFSMAILTLALLSSTPATAQEWHILGAKVTQIEPTSLPSDLFFRVDQDAVPGDHRCEMGVTLNYVNDEFARGTPTQLRNTELVYPALLAALLSGHTVDLVGTFRSCTVIGVRLN
jgi:hypothetical protein